VLQQFAASGGNEAVFQSAEQTCTPRHIAREQTRAEILAAVEEAEKSLAKGEGRPITPESMRALAEDVKRRGRERMAVGRRSDMVG
jgi:hypothetical protein